MCDVSEDLAVLLSSKPHLRSDVSHYLNGVNQVDALVADFRNAVKNTVLGPLQSMLTQQAELQVRDFREWSWHAPCAACPARGHTRAW